MTEAEKWILGCTIVGAICAVGALVVAVIAINKKTETVISPQPLAITIVEEMHKRFADKVLFDDHVKNNTQRHAQLFNEVDRVEREVREQLERKLAELNEDRRRTLESLNGKIDSLQREVTSMPSRMLADILNAAKIGRNK